MLCGCIGEKTTNSCLKQIKKSRQDGADLVELRIDYLKNEDKLKQIISASSLPVIATDRKGEQKILIEAINAGAKYIDMDIDEIDKEVLKYAKHKGCKIILSYHNYKNTPPIESLMDIAGVLKRDADIVKVITTAKSQSDNRIILSLYQRVNCSLIAFSMGKIGQSTRIECLAYGALWTYCGVGKSRIAPGQIDLRQAKKKKLYCVIGNPIKHSMSPAMHNANFESLNINARYISVPVQNLERYMENIALRGISGVNVTIPYKVAIMKYLDKIDPLAKKIGAVNTIQNKNGTLIGYNTDASGSLRSVKEKVKNIKKKKVVMLGSGGAARAIYFILREEKADVVILAININEAKKIGKSLKLNKENLKRQLGKADILINCTPVGMDSNESLVPKEYLRKELVVFDIVYNPIKTRMIKDAESIGCKTVLGYKMLAYQGAQTFEIWTGLKANVSVMLDAVKQQLLPNIALVGFMGTGKTRVGKILAKNLQRHFIDVDGEIERREKMPISKIFSQQGEPYFRKLEKKMLKEISGKKNLIISCGGGIVLDEENRNILKSFVVALLKAKPEVIMNRLRNNRNRPLLKGLNNQEKINRINSITRERNHFYNEVADYSIKTDDCRPKEVARRIEELIKKI